MGGGGDIHTRVLKRMHRVLLEETTYPYLQANARARLAEARALARRAHLDESNILPMGGNKYCIFPWLGSIAYRTLERLLRLRIMGKFGVNSIQGIPPYFLTLTMKTGDEKSLLRGLLAAAQNTRDNEQLLSSDDTTQSGKYDEFVPEPLLRKSFASERLDIVELRSDLAKW
jgi:ATP-dependent Lhr-like helicase